MVLSHKYSFFGASRRKIIWSCVKSILSPAAAKFYFERHVIFTISLCEIVKMTCLSKHNLALSVQSTFRPYGTLEIPWPLFSAHIMPLTGLPLFGKSMLSLLVIIRQNSTSGLSILNRKLPDVLELPKGLTVMPEYKVSSVPVVSINSMFSKNFAMSAPLLKCMSHPSGAK